LLPTDREDGEPASEERMCRVGYLDLVRRQLRQIVERGITEGFRSIAFLMPS